jgi:hypothetical protein
MPSIASSNVASARFHSMLATQFASMEDLRERNLLYGSRVCSPRLSYRFTQWKVGITINWSRLCELESEGH